MGVAAVCNVCRAEKRKPGITAEREERDRLRRAGMNRCGTCRLWLPAEDFNVSQKNKTGLCGKCRKCAAAALVAWREANPGGYREWAEKNKGNLSERNKAYREANRTALRESYAAWAKANKPLLNARVAKRTAQRLRAMPPWADAEAIKAIYAERDRLTRETGVRYDVDHYYPLQGETVCGLHCEANLRIVTKLENQRKKNRMPEEPHEA